MKTNKGITLVALVITIIILLILAGVAISMITGGDGLFAKANESATKYNQAAKNEVDLLNQLLNGNYTGGGNGQGGEETPKEPVPDLIKDSNMNFIYKPDTWTNVTVKVEITTNVTGYTLQYSLDEGTSWLPYTDEIPVTTNGKVILARLADGERTGGIATGEVANIDTEKPKAFNLKATAEGTSITVSAEGSVEDGEETETSGKSEIRGYKFKLMNNDGTTKVDWTTEQINPSYIFNTGLMSGTTYKVSMMAIDNAGNSIEATNGKLSVTTERGPAINNNSHVGYYADMDADGTVDGIIFADLAVGGSGEWGGSNGAYTIPLKTGLKEYYVSKDSYTVASFGTKPVLSPKEGSEGEDRFYVMALENFGGSTYYTWYDAAFGKMEDYATATSVEFGKGRANTTKMIGYWNNKTYGEQNTKDIWGKIQGKVGEGWFVPSRGEWAAFAQQLGITKTNYGNYGLSNGYWSSSQSGTMFAWAPAFHTGDMGLGTVAYWDQAYNTYIRLCTTF